MQDADKDIHVVDVRDLVDKPGNRADSVAEKIRIGEKENCPEKQVFSVKPEITFKPIVRIKEVFPDIFEPVKSTDFPFISIEFLMQLVINGW